MDASETCPSIENSLLGIIPEGPQPAPQLVGEVGD